MVDSSELSPPRLQAHSGAQPKRAPISQLSDSVLDRYLYMQAIHTNNGVTNSLSDNGLYTLALSQTSMRPSELRIFSWWSRVDFFKGAQL